MTPLAATDITLFWSLVRRGRPDECWEWQGGRNGDGYGYFKQQRAHRLAYWLTVAKPQRYVLHGCNNRLCCNPKHLYDGTHKQNMRDMTTAGRHDGRNRRGEQHPHPLDKCQCSLHSHVKPQWCLTR